MKNSEIKEVIFSDYDWGANWNIYIDGECRTKDFKHSDVEDEQLLRSLFPNARIIICSDGGVKIKENK